MLKEFVARPGLRESHVCVMLSRDFGQRPGVRDPTQLTPQIDAYAIPYALVFTPSEQIHGISAVVAPHRGCDAV